MGQPVNPSDTPSAFQCVRKLVRKAAVDANRDPSEVKIVAVSKTVSEDRVESAITDGAYILGENYIQEAREKVTSLSHLPVSWHFIGHLQSNKAKYAVRLFDLIHSVDSLKLAKEIDHHAERIEKTQDILVQVNVSGEKSKSGVSVQDAPALIQGISYLTHVRIKGLMTMPPFFDAPEKVRPYFRTLRELARDIARLGIVNVDMTELSMGMSGDFEAAISEGATLVRIGTAIFGARK
jgi:pyridoxal phosphate enzyme (YggS family)